MTAKIGLRSMLDLSTSHLPSDSPDFGPVRYKTNFWGWIVWVIEPHNRTDIPTWLVPILTEAFNHDCILINFDADAEVVESFKTYDW